MNKLPVSPSQGGPENLLPVTQIIKRSGVDYHTLRYYTKIGLLPYMVRRLPYPGAESTTGHYPQSVLETLKTIEDLKSKGLKNEQIKVILNLDEAKKQLAPVVPSKTLSGVEGPPSHSHFPLAGAFLTTLLLLFLGTGAYASLYPQEFQKYVLAPLASSLLTGGAQVEGTMRFLEIIFFGETDDYFITPLGDASFRNLTAGSGIFSSLTTNYLTVTRSETIAGLNADFLDGQDGSYYLAWENTIGKPLVLSSVEGVSNNEGNIDLVASGNITITPNDSSNTITFTVPATAQGSGSGLNADLLDSLDSTQFLRSDTSDSFSSGTLTFNSGTTLSITSGSALSVAGSFTATSGISSGTILPLADDAHDLGSTSLRWRDLFIGPTSLHLASTVGETTTARDWKLAIQETDGATEGNFRILEGANELLNITPGGNVGIGTTGPAEQLHVAGTAGTRARIESTGTVSSWAELRLKGANTNADWSIGTNFAADGAAVDSLYFYKHLGDIGTKMVITNSGNVGIGTTSPNKLLQLSPSSTDTALRIDSTTGQSITFSVSGTNKGVFGLARAANEFITGSVANDLIIQNQDASANILFGTTNGPERMRINASGNVGIGTTNPSEKLHVQSGSLLVSPALSAPTGLNATATTGGSIPNGSNWSYRVTALNATGETTASTNSDIVVNSPNNAVSLTWNAVSGATSYRIYRNDRTVNRVYFTSATNSFTDTGAAGTSGFPPDVNGTGGGRIGAETTPNKTLTLSGTSLKITGSLGTNLISTSQRFGYSEGDLIKLGEYITIDSGGIDGGNDPIIQLAVNGITFRNENAGALGSTTIKKRVGSSYEDVFSVDNSTGNLTLGTGTTGCVKDADATVIAGTCSSDIRLKTNIESLGSVLSKVAGLDPVYFNFRSSEFPEMNLGTERQTGLIAQEVEKVLPELVTTDEKGFKQIRFNYLPFFLIQAVKELDGKTKELEDDLKIDSEGDLAKTTQTGETEKIVAEEVEATSGIFGTINSTISAVFNKLTAKTAGIARLDSDLARLAEAVIGKLTVKDLAVSGGLRLTAEAVKPTCGEETRGTLWLTKGGIGEKDVFEVCAKDENDLYSWESP